MNHEEHKQTGIEIEILGILTSQEDITCPVCQHVLPTLTTAQCPVCEVPLNVRLGSPDLKLAAWLTGLITICVPLGLFSITAVYFSIAMILFQGSVNSKVPIWTLISWMMTGVLVVVVWQLIARRRKFWQMSRDRQWWVAVWCIGGSLLTIFGIVLAAYFDT